MKVLMDGKVNNKWIGKCRECGAIIAAYSTEVGEIHQCNQPLGDMSSGDCPYCGQPNGVNFVRSYSPAGKRMIKVVQDRKERQETTKYLDKWLGLSPSSKQI